LLAARVAALRDDLTLVRREYPTDIGPVDLLCRDGDGRAIVIEVKAVGEIAGVRPAAAVSGASSTATPVSRRPRHVRGATDQAPGHRCTPRAKA
jgi:hypothetical protein